MLKFGYTRKFLSQWATTADSMIRLLAIFANELLTFFAMFGSLLIQILLKQSWRFSYWHVLRERLILNCRRNLWLLSNPCSVKLCRPLHSLSLINSEECARRACTVGVNFIHAMLFSFRIDLAIKAVSLQKCS